MRDDLKPVMSEMSRRLDEEDTDIRAIVVTADGWAIVSEEASRHHAKKMLDGVAFEDALVADVGGGAE